MATYALSDIHGFKSIYVQAKKILRPEDKVIFLGDAADRGPRGWQCVTAILDDSQFEYILGNHDLFMIRSILGPDRLHNTRLWDINGGKETQASMEHESEENICKYLSRLIKCPYYKVYDNEAGDRIFLSHSGRYTAEALKDAKATEAFTWDRVHFPQSVPEEVDYIVHGHTPIRYLISLLSDYDAFLDKDMKEEGSTEFIPGEPFFYCGRHKIDIDNGTVQTGYATLLNLDTFESIPLQVQGWEKDCLWR